jgi:hypothetical protein
LLAIGLFHISFLAQTRPRSNVQVLQVAAGKLLVSNDLDLAIALLGDLDDLAEVTGAALDLDAVVEELLESLDVKDLIVDGLAAVDDELLRHLLGLLAGCLLHCLSAYCSAHRGDVCDACAQSQTAKRWTYGGGCHF